MQIKRVLHPYSIVTLFTIWMGCAYNTVPDKWLATAENSPVDAYGGWIELSYQIKAGISKVDGELIALEKDSVYVLSYRKKKMVIPSDSIIISKITRSQEDRSVEMIQVKYLKDNQNLDIMGELMASDEKNIMILAKVPELIGVYKPKVISAKLTVFDPDYGGLAVWTVVGTLSTISHGFWALLSAPTWIITGSLAGRVQSYKPEYTFPEGSSLNDLSKYARFPQGMPKGINRKEILSKK